MAKKRTELETRLLKEHGRVITVVERWQSEQLAVDEVRASLAKAEARLDDAVLEAADLGSPCPERSHQAKVNESFEIARTKEVALGPHCLDSRGFAGIILKQPSQARDTHVNRSIQGIKLNVAQAGVDFIA